MVLFKSKLEMERPWAEKGLVEAMEATCFSVLALEKGRKKVMEVGL